MCGVVWEKIATTMWKKSYLKKHVIIRAKICSRYRNSLKPYILFRGFLNDFREKQFRSC